MKLCVHGLWHLGSVTAACLAALGHDVTGLDFDSETIEQLSGGHAPVHEPGLEDLLKRGVAQGNLRFSQSAREATAGAQVHWVTYDTPVNDGDVADHAFVLDQIAHVMPHLGQGVIVLVSSQLPVGSIRRLEEMARQVDGTSLEFAYSPENLRLGAGVETFLKPGRIVVGARQRRAREVLGRLLATIETRLEWMSVESAEMTKHALNGFLATSIAFSNEVASICEVVGADAKDVERGLKTESRIGPKAYLSPGAAFAGGTLARDVSFLNVLAETAGIVTPLLASIQASNEGHKHWVRRHLQAHVPVLNGATIAVWGLTYKPGTDTLRRSMAVELCDWLINEGARVRVHDPAAGALPEPWAGRVHRCDGPLDALVGAQALVVGTEWPVYRDICDEIVIAPGRRLTLLDAGRFCSALAEVPGINYVAVGIPTGLDR